MTVTASAARASLVIARGAGRVAAVFPRSVTAALPLPGADRLLWLVLVIVCSAPDMSSFLSSDMQTLF